MSYDRNVQIDASLISYLEDLSYLKFTESEKLRLIDDLQGILSGMAHLGHLELDADEDQEDTLDSSHTFDNANAFREDETAASTSRQSLLKNAPSSDGVAFLAPRII